MAKLGLMGIFNAQKIYKYCNLLF